MFDGQFRIAEHDFYPAADPPRRCQARIERERPIDERGARVRVAD